MEKQSLESHGNPSGPCRRELAQSLLNSNLVAYVSLAQEREGDLPPRLEAPTLGLTTTKDNPPPAPLSALPRNFTESLCSQLLA